MRGGRSQRTFGNMLRRRLPAGFIVPAQPVERDKPPVGAGWVHEIKWNGYRLIVRRDGKRARVFTRLGGDWTGPSLVLRSLCARYSATAWAGDFRLRQSGPQKNCNAGAS